MAARAERTGLPQGLVPSRCGGNPVRSARATTRAAPTVQHRARPQGTGLSRPLLRNPVRSARAATRAAPTVQHRARPLGTSGTGQARPLRARPMLHRRGGPCGRPRRTHGVASAAGRDKPVPNGRARCCTVGAALVAARAERTGFLSSGRDKPVPYGRARCCTVGAALVAARAERTGLPQQRDGTTPPDGSPAPARARAHRPAPAPTPQNSASITALARRFCDADS